MDTAGEEMRARIVLAHEDAFRLGSLEVRPATRTVARNGAATVLEPRVMQLLVALARADGAVVSRDGLVESCWDGRIVGDDAINRALSRLRRLSAGIGAGAFAIETIPRIGYRLMAGSEGEEAGAPPVDAHGPHRSASGPSRRAVLALAGVTALAGGAGTWALLGRQDGLSAEARDALDRGLEALRDTTPDRTAVAVAAFREAAAAAPDAARPWGLLALAYRQQLKQSGARDAAEAEQLQIRAREAATRALAIDGDNADAQVALAALVPDYPRWLAVDRRYRQLLVRYPDHGTLNRLYGALLTEVGRFRASIPCFRRALAADPRRPQLHVQLATSLWSANRLDEADAALDDALKSWPRHYSVWFARQRLLTYSGRGAAALAMIADKSSRPVGIPEWNFTLTDAETRAMATRSSADVDAASRLYFEAARRGVGFAANGIIFHAAVGRVDDAFRIIEAYYFNRGFQVGASRYSEEQAMYDRDRQRSAYFLHKPQTAALRRDPRFPPLTRAIGLDEYWRGTGTRPDTG